MTILLLIISVSEPSSVSRLFVGGYLIFD